jgi:hypothetical protein
LTILVGASLFFLSTGALFFQEAIATYVETRWVDMEKIRERFDLKEDDVDKAVDFIKKLFTAVGSVGYVLIILQAFALDLAIHFLTTPMVMKNLVRDANLYVILIGIGQMVLGYEAQEHTHLLAGNDWVAILFLSSGSFLIVCDPFGIVLFFYLHS